MAIIFARGVDNFQPFPGQVGRRCIKTIPGLGPGGALNRPVKAAIVRRLVDCLPFFIAEAMLDCIGFVIRRVGKRSVEFAIIDVAKAGIFGKAPEKRQLVLQRPDISNCLLE